MLADHVSKSQKRVVQLLAVQFFELFDLKVDSMIAAYPDPSFPCEGYSLQGYYCMKLLLFCDIMTPLLNMTLTFGPEKLHVTCVFSLQVMLLGNSLHLPPPVLMIPSPSDVLLLETIMGKLPGEWVGAIHVSWHIMQQLVYLHVDLSSQPQLGLGLE